MTTQDTQAAIAEIRERAEKATQGELELMRYEHGGGRLGQFGSESPDRILVADFYHEGDREFYASAHNDVLWLLAALEAAQAEIKKLRATYIDLETD